MKFFDLEMDNCLAKGIKGGTRDISYVMTQQGKCYQAKYTHGYSNGTCGTNRYTTSASQCETSIEILKNGVSID